ncbi:MAG: hypothetical protein LBG97_00650 [Coriobacteriales bacterium]|nr:hypothetical protein [Coriobacteriales bacterium]
MLDRYGGRCIGGIGGVGGGRTQFAPTKRLHHVAAARVARRGGYHPPAIWATALERPCRGDLWSPAQTEKCTN